MIPMYMKEGYKGAYSKIQYGLKGDKVYIIDRDIDGTCLLINESGLKFYLNISKLSHQKIEKDERIDSKTNAVPQGSKRKV